MHDCNAPGAPRCSTIPSGAFNNLPRAKKLEHPEPKPPEPMWMEAVKAADAKQAKEIRVLDLREITAFADYFVICTGGNSRQIQTIADEIQMRLKKLGEQAHSVEGYQNAEWVLMDYGDYLIHIFSEKARPYYDLERLWRDAKTVAL
jgi:ribosome-associated protein